MVAVLDRRFNWITSKWWAAASPVQVEVQVQLPFWVWTTDCDLSLDLSWHRFKIAVRSEFIEVHLGEFSDSRVSCAYVGPPELRVDSEFFELIQDPETAVATRKCKTTLQVSSALNADVLRAFDEGGHRRRQAELYLRAFCEGHLPIVRMAVQKYRLATYDYHAFAVAAWDVPVWFVTDAAGTRLVSLYPERSWDRPSVIFPSTSTSEGERYSLIEPNDLQDAFDSAEPSPGEFEVLDALNLMERGDYSGAVRRITTAIEVVVAAALTIELKNGGATAAEVTARLARTTMNLRKRIRDYENVSHRQLPQAHWAELRRTRSLRNDIVHRGLRIEAADRGIAQRSVDTGRWTYNWFENMPQRATVREKRIAKRSLGRGFSIFETGITSAGVEVEKAGVALQQPHVRPRPCDPWRRPPSSLGRRGLDFSSWHPQASRVSAPASSQRVGALHH